LETSAPAEDVAAVTIRDFRMEDYEAVLDLWGEAGLPFRPQGRDARHRVAAELTGGRAVFLVAEVEDRPVGVVLGTHDGRKGWVNRLAVNPAFRRRGIATTLVRELETRLEALGLDVIAALIESEDQASLGFSGAVD
jgi:ribosomal protein S18 acetylase RimI-like enzyme